MYFPKNHFLANLFDEKVKILNSVGLIDYWISKYLKDKLMEVSSPTPKKLTMDQLAGGMYVLFAGFSIAVFVFFIELFSFVLSECTWKRK